MAWNEAYIILASRIFNIFSFKTNKLLVKIEDNKNPNVIIFLSNDCKIFLSSSHDPVKIFKIKNKQSEILNDINFGKGAYIKDKLFYPK